MSTAGTEKLGSLLTSFNTLEVEDYQRVYVWNDENILSLFRDVTECLANKDDRDHFFGTLILQTDGSQSPKSAKVVDGQQRITTIMLIIAALRDALSDLESTELPGDDEELGIDVKREAWKLLIHSRKLTDYRFHPNRLLRAIWETSVMPTPSEDRKPVPWGKTKSYEKATTLNKPFRKAVKFTRELIAQDLKAYEHDSEKLTRIYALLSTIRDRFTVLKVITSSIDESLDIFLTLNSRGQELKSSDLARGEILKKRTSGLTDEKEVQRIHKENLDEWNRIGQLVSDHDVFLRHFLVSTSDQQITKKQVLTEVGNRLNGTESDGLSDAKRAIDFWSSLSKAADVYGEIMSPTKGTVRTQKYLEMLELLMMSHRVLLLNVVGKVKSEVDLEEIVRLTFVLAYRWTLLGQNAQDLENFFRKTGRAFATSKDIDKLKAKLRSEISGLAEINPKKWETARDASAHARALLYMIYYLLNEDGSPVELDKMHLEHIAPQAKTPHWSNVLFGEDDVDDDDYEDVITGAGNLTLLDPKLNIKAKNLDFSVKKKDFYSRSKVDIVLDLMDFEEWSRDLINDRAQWLHEMFEVIWAIEKSSKQIKSYKQWRLGELD